MLLNYNYRNDGDNGLMHVGARYYDAQVGRFITRDTFLNQKPYLYCEHDPVNMVDPTGHFGSWQEIGGILLMGLGVAIGETTAPVWIPIIIIIGGGVILYRGAIKEIEEYGNAINNIGTGMDNGGEGLGSGHGGMTPGSGDFDHLTEKWEHETN